jgi:PLP dependent protein
VSSLLQKIIKVRRRTPLFPPSCFDAPSPTLIESSGKRGLRMNEIVDNLRAVKARIAEAARASGRSPGEISLVAIAKTHDRAAVEAALAAGQTIFGENRVQEAEAKYRPPLPGVELHLVGPLQSNKTRNAAALFDRIHSLDRIKIARRLEAHLEETGRTMQALIQVNIAGEEQKSGVSEKELPDFLEQLSSLKRLRVDGLMIIPPFFDDPNESIPYFRRLRELRDELNRKEVGGTELRHLSMGMTNDFPQAIAEGATMIRVGTAIFGARNY